MTFSRNSARSPPAEAAPWRLWNLTLRALGGLLELNAGAARHGEGPTALVRPPQAAT